MKDSIALLLLLSSFLSSCSIGTRSDHSTMAGRITNLYCKQVYQTDKMIASASGGGMMGDVQKINLHFEKELNCDMAEARALFIRKSRQLLDMINKDKEIRPYLRNYPFTLANIDFSIRFVKPDGAVVKYPFVNRVWSYKNEVVYTQFDIDGFIINPSYSEQYEEAVRLVGEAGIEE